jgi:hypothetical protein
LSAHLESARPRDVAALGYSVTGARGVHAAYAAAGATWWLENLHERRAPFEEMLARVRAGP